MPRTLPIKIDHIIDFFLVHTERWEAAGGGSELGLSAQQLERVRAAVLAARQADQAQAIAQDAAKSATLRRDEALRELELAGRAAVATIKAHIKSSDDPALWAVAGLEPDAVGGRGRGAFARTPSRGLRPPEDLRAVLLADGSLKISFSARQPASATGVVYTVERRIDNAPPALVGIALNKSFVDDRVPTAPVPRQITYLITARRGSAASSASTPIVVTFGSEPASTTTVSSTAASATMSMRRAA